MSLAVLADHVASKGRDGDSMLVHMSPEEVRGLHALALTHGGQMTINPETGLPEAFSLSSVLKAVLPAVAGFALGPAGFGIVSSALGAGALVGGATALASGSLQKGIMAGLGAYGGFGLGEALAGAGANAVGTAGALGVPGASTAVGSQAEMLAAQNAGFGAEGIQRLADSAAYAKGAAPSLTAALQQGASYAMDNPMAFAKAAAKPLLAAAAPVMADMMVPTATAMPGAGKGYQGMIRPYTFDPYTRRWTAQTPYPTSQEAAKTQEQFGGAQAQPAPQPQPAPGEGMASGGIVALADGGTPPTPSNDQIKSVYQDLINQGMTHEGILAAAARNPNINLSADQITAALGQQAVPAAGIGALAATTPATYGEQIVPGTNMTVRDAYGVLAQRDPNLYRTDNPLLGREQGFFSTQAGSGTYAGTGSVGDYVRREAEMRDFADRQQMDPAMIAWQLQKPDLSKITDATQMKNALESWQKSRPGYVDPSKFGTYQEYEGAISAQIPAWSGSRQDPSARQTLLTNYFGYSNPDDALQAVGVTPGANSAETQRLIAEKRAQLKQYAPQALDRFEKGVAAWLAMQNIYGGGNLMGQFQQGTTQDIKRRPSAAMRSFAAGGPTLPSDIGTYTPEQKADLYNQFLSQGFNDAAIRQAAGQQTDANWQTLQQLAAQRGTPTVSGAERTVLTDPNWRSISGQTGIAGLNANIQNFIQQNPNIAYPQIAAAAQQYGVDAEDIRRAIEASGGSGGMQRVLTSPEWRSRTGLTGLEGMNKNIQMWMAENPQATEAQIRQAMAAVDINEADVMRATGKSVADLAYKPKTLAPTTGGTTITPASLPAPVPAPAPEPVTPKLAPATQFTPQTMEQVRSAYEQGGGATRMPTITDIKPGERTYTQNQVFGLLNNFLKSNPNALYGDVLQFARSNGIPEYQARSAYNEFRFNTLTGDTASAYNYLMGRGAYPAGTIRRPVMVPYAEAMGLAPRTAGTTTGGTTTGGTTTGGTTTGGTTTGGTTTTRGGTVTGGDTDTLIGGGVTTLIGGGAGVGGGTGGTGSTAGTAINPETGKPYTPVGSTGTPIMDFLFGKQDPSKVEVVDRSTYSPDAMRELTEYDERIRELEHVTEEDRNIQDILREQAEADLQRRIELERLLEGPSLGHDWSEWQGTPAGYGGGSGLKNQSEADEVVHFGRGGISMLAAAAARGGNVQQYNLGGYSDGGRLLRGPGDGVSDSIPATIGNRQPARLADGEFVIPARIVSEIGNGSTEAGARKLYAMMDRVQRARAKTTGKGKVAKNTKADQYLPA